MLKEFKALNISKKCSAKNKLKYIRHTKNKNKISVFCRKANLYQRIVKNLNILFAEWHSEICNDRRQRRYMEKVTHDINIVAWSNLKQKITLDNMREVLFFMIIQVF